MKMKKILIVLILATGLYGFDKCEHIMGNVKEYFAQLKAYTRAEDYSFACMYVKLTYIEAKKAEARGCQIPDRFIEIVGGMVDQCVEMGL